LYGSSFDTISSMNTTIRLLLEHSSCTKSLFTCDMCTRNMWHPPLCGQTKRHCANSTRPPFTVAEMALAIARDVVGRVVGQLQRVDAFLLHQLSNNVQQLQHQFQQTSPGTPEGQTPRGREAFHRMAAGESEMIAIQIAPWTFLTSGYAWSLLIMVGLTLTFSSMFTFTYYLTNSHCLSRPQY